MADCRLILEVDEEKCATRNLEEQGAALAACLSMNGVDDSDNMRCAIT
jgi:hypothetical protein